MNLSMEIVCLCAQSPLELAIILVENLRTHIKLQISLMYALRDCNIANLVWIGYTIILCLVSTGLRERLDSPVAIIG